MTLEVRDVRQFCGVDRLQITCLRRSENPSAVTAKTPKFGLEVLRRLRARLHHGPQSHQVIVLAATGQLGMAAAGQIPLAVVTRR